VTLNEYAAGLRRRIFDDLSGGREPSIGRFDAIVFGEARAKGSPQVGATRYLPSTIVFEFAYPERAGSTVILSVEVDAPERIVFLPVPEWVVESIWQGDVDGSYQFESQAYAMVERFAAGLEPEANLVWFGPRSPKRRE